MGRSIPAAPGLPRALADSASVADALDCPRAGSGESGPCDGGVEKRDIRDRVGRGVSRGELDQISGDNVLCWRRVTRPSNSILMCTLLAQSNKTLKLYPAVYFAGAKYQDPPTLPFAPATLGSRGSPGAPMLRRREAEGGSPVGRIAGDLRVCERFESKASLAMMCQIYSWRTKEFQTII